MSRVSFCLTCVLCHAQQTPAKIHRYATSFSSPAADGGIDFLLPFSRAGRSPFPSQRVRTIAISQPLKSNEIQANAYSQILVNRPMRMWYVVAVESPNQKSKKEKKRASCTWKDEWVGRLSLFSKPRTFRSKRNAGCAFWCTKRCRGSNNVCLHSSRRTRRFFAFVAWPGRKARKRRNEFLRHAAA